MADRKDSSEDIGALTKQMETINTADANKNNQERSKNSEITSNTNRKSVTQLKDERPSSTAGNIFIEKQLPAINVPEKIVFIIDTVVENDSTLFEFESGYKFSSLNMIKRIIEVFINAKATINSKHEFALMMLEEDSVQWVCDWTSSLKRFITSMDRISETCLEDGNQSWYDLSDCFETLNDKLNITSDITTSPFITRAILIYSRSFSLPQFTETRYVDLLKQNQYFFLDIIYVHEPDTLENKCEDIYSKLCELDTKEDSYIFEVGRNSAVIHNMMAKLLAHPLQRPRQNKTSYEICTPEIITVV